MPSVQVRDLPQELYDQLVEASRRDRRSIAQETTYIIEEYCSQTFASGARGERSRVTTLPQPSVRQRHHDEVRRSISSLPPLTVPRGFPTVPELIASERDSR